ncbi:MAG: Crp/Fnr family transcriptional regulator [Ignavibacteriaceae bacterium]
MIEQSSKITLKEVPLFSELSVDDFRQITALSNLIKVKKNDFIFHEGDEFKGLFIVLKGSVKIYKISREGKEYILHFINPPNVFGDVPLFTGGDCPADVQALEDSILLFVPKNEFLNLLANNSKLSLKIMTGFAYRLKSLSVKAAELSLSEVINRLAGYLINEIEKSGTANLPEPHIKLSISIATLASYLGTISESISRAMKKLRDNKIIRMHGKTIFIEDFNKLKNLAR